MPYEITIFAGSQRNAGEPHSHPVYETFEQMATDPMITKCRKGGKHQDYFTRGKCEHRNNKSIKSSKLLIIDGDWGLEPDDGKAPEPKAVAEALDSLGLNYIITTTHSHSEEVNKFRAIIPTNTEYFEYETKHNIKCLLRALKMAGVEIGHAPEMNVWSQPWYLPKRDFPRDGIYECYVKHDGEPWEVRSVDKPDGFVSEAEKYEAEEKAEAEKAAAESKTREEMANEIQTGANFHDNLTKTAWGMLKDANKVGTLEQSIPFVISVCQAMMNTSKDAGTERWVERYNDIERMVKQTATKLSAECDVVDFQLACAEPVEVRVGNSKPPMPHGLLGKFIRETKQFMLYEDDTLAFVSAIFICCSIAGRKFNVDIHDKDGRAKPTALNMYLTLVAETGVGKSEIESAVENCYVQFAGSNGNVQDFFYKGRLSGPRALYNIYQSRKCLGVISNEKGISDQSKLGDTMGMKDAWLNLYGQGAWNKWSGASELSDTSQSIKSIRAVALSRIGESTLVELKKAYSSGDQVANGLIPRESIFIIRDINIEPNLNIRREYSQDIVDRMEEMISTCHSDNSEDSLFKPYIITVDDPELLKEMIDTQRYYRQQQDIGETMHIRSMSSRMFVKILRYCGIITVFNKWKGSERALLIDRQDWEWAKSVVEEEFDRVGDIVELTEGGELGDALRYTRQRIHDMLNDKIGVSYRLKDGEKREKTIPLGMLKRSLKQNKHVKAVADWEGKANPKSGPQKIVEYMIREGYAKECLNVHRNGKAIRLTEEFNYMGEG